MLRFSSRFLRWRGADALRVHHRPQGGSRVRGEERLLETKSKYVGVGENRVPRPAPGTRPYLASPGLVRTRRGVPLSFLSIASSRSLSYPCLYKSASRLAHVWPSPVLRVSDPQRQHEKKTQHRRMVLNASPIDSYLD